MSAAIHRLPARRSPPPSPPLNDNRPPWSDLAVPAGDEAELANGVHDLLFSRKPIRRFSARVLGFLARF